LPAILALSFYSLFPVAHYFAPFAQVQQRDPVPIENASERSPRKIDASTSYHLQRLFNIKA
jgi:hypothetical protein